jgi:RimJ/RimL family protein N-acetyltransferase
VIIQPLSPDDISQIPPLLPPGWDTAMPAIKFYTTSEFCFPIKLTMDNKIVGTGTTIIHRDVAWLAHILVHPDHRNQGIGRFITQRLVETANEKNCKTIYLLATELGEPVYRKIGFEPETEYVTYKGELQIEAWVDTHNIVTYADHLKEPISTLDTRVSGEDRMFHLEQHLSSGFVYVVDNIVEGYYLPTLGDGLIIATTSEAGHALMTLRMTTKDFAVFPMDNESATAYIQQHSFTEIRRQKRMRLGVKRNWQPAYIYNRIGGNLG